MLHRKLLLLGFCWAALGVGQHLVAVLPATGNDATTLRLFDPKTLDLIVAARQANLAADIKQIIPVPGVNKYFLIARNSTPVSVLDGATGAVRGISGGINLAASSALLIPDASRLAVTAGRLYLIDATTELLKDGAGIEIPGTIIDIAATFDSSRLMVLSQVASGDLVVSAVDLATEKIAGTLSLPGSTDTAAGGIMMAPNGRIYVSGINHVYEVDPRTNRVTVNGDILLPGMPGKAVASPDGQYLVLPNLKPPQGMFQITVGNKLPIVSASLGNDTFDTFAARRSVTGAEGMIGFTRGGHLYDVGYFSSTLTPSYADAFFSEGGVAHPVYQSAAFSNEWYPRRMAITKSSGDQVALYSVDLTSGDLARMALPNQPWRVALITPSALDGQYRMVSYNTTQTVAAGTRASLPLVVRLVEPLGRGVFGAPVTFTSNAAGVVIEPSATVTGVDGFAQASVIAGDTAGPFSVTASSPGVPDVTFTLNVPATPNGADRGGLFIVSGNGQVVREGSKTATPMVVQLLDLNGNPVVDAAVTWVLRDGLGAVLPVGSRTDASGLARANFAASVVTISESYTQAVVEAATATGKVTFHTTTTPNGLGSGIAPDPTVAISYPDFNVTRTFNGRVGGVIKNAIGIRVASSSGPLTGKGIPNVGLLVSTTPPVAALETPPPPAGFTAACGANDLTDAQGFLNCDLVIGPRTGMGGLYMNAGGFRNLPNGLLNVTLGEPGNVFVVVGNSQTARVGSALPTPLTARVTDAGGNVLEGVTVSWTVSRGTAVLSDAKVATDRNGNSTIKVQLGATPGPVTIRAAVDETRFALFTLTATIVYGGVSVVSGDGQAAFTGAPFGNALGVVVKDSQGQIVPGVPVTFTTTGGLRLSAATALTDATGVARITATAGLTVGPAAITASLAGFTATLGVRVLSRSPVVDGFSNAASRESGVTACGLVAITGSSLAPGVSGVVEASGAAPLPYALGPVDGVLMGGVAAPLVSISDERLVVQAPCELTGGTAMIRVKGLEPAVVSGLGVLALQPGIFEYLGDDGLRYAKLLDGGAAKRGTTVRVMVTGLGAVSPRALTNVAGVEGQTVDAAVVVGINDAGVTVVGARYLAGAVGIYVVEIAIPADLTPGPRSTITVAATGADGVTVYSPVSYVVVE